MDFKLPLDKEEIKKIIPHREPFLLIDEVIELIPGKSVKAKKYVKSDEEYFKGHFPGEPVMPGVLIIESLAQAGAVGVLSLEENKGKIAFFGGIKNAKFRGMVKPGDELLLELTLGEFRRNVGFGTGVCYLNDKKIVSTEISFALI